MTKLYVKNGKMLVINGKLRQCCCQPPTPNVIQLRNAYTAINIAGYPYPPSIGIQHFEYRYEGSPLAWVSGYSSVDTLCGSGSGFGWGPAGSSIKNAYTFEYYAGRGLWEVTKYPADDSESYVVFTLTEQAFFEAGAGHVFWSVDEPAETLNGCSVPATTVILRRAPLA